MRTSLADLTDDRFLLAAVVADQKPIDRTDPIPRGWLAARCVDGRIAQTFAPGERLDRPQSANTSLLLIRQSPWLIDFIELELVTRDHRDAAVFVSLEVRPRPEPVELSALARLIRELPEGPRLTQTNLSRRLAADVGQAIRDFAAQVNLVDLVERPDEARLAQAMAATLAKALFTAGLELRGISRLRVESDDYDQSRQAEREAAQAEEAARLTDQVARTRHQVRSQELDRLSQVLDRLSELGERLGEVAGEGPRARQLGALLTQLSPADQQAVVSGSLELSEADSQSPPPVLLAAGSEILLVDPARREHSVVKGLEDAIRAIGPLRWIGFDQPGLLLGGRDGLAVARIQSAATSASNEPAVINGIADAVYALPPNGEQADRRGGINSAAVVGRNVIATHSEVGLIAWPLDGPDLAGQIVVAAPADSGEVRASITRGSMSVMQQGHSVRAATVANDGGLLFAIDNSILRAELAPDGSPVPACLLTVRSPVTSMAADGDDLYIGEHAGHITRFSGGRAEVIASLAGPIVSIQPIVYGWLSRLLVSAGPAGLALVQPDTRLTSALAQSGAGSRQAIYCRGWVIAISGRRDRIVWYRRLAPGQGAEPDASVSVYADVGHSAQAIAAA